jgi:hypothetical protein
VSGDGGTNLWSGVPAKQLKSQQVYPGLRKASPTYMAFSGQYTPQARHPYIGDVCLVARVGLGAQHILGGPEFTGGARSMPEAHLVLGFAPKC